jgi:hypothetical protein
MLPRGGVIGDVGEGGCAAARLVTWDEGANWVLGKCVSVESKSRRAGAAAAVVAVAGPGRWIKVAAAAAWAASSAALCGEMGMAVMPSASAISAALRDALWRACCSAWLAAICVARCRAISSSLEVRMRVASASTSAGVPWAAGRTGICELLMKTAGDG